MSHLALERARLSAHAPGEGFMTAGEIRALAVRAGVGPGVTVLDVCCGIAGPGRLLTRELGCAYLGVDASAAAIARARERSRDLPCRFAIGQVPPLPAGPFDVVLLLETMLAFEDKDALVREIAKALRPGGRFAFTLEEGAPLTAAERAAMPGQRHGLAHPARRADRVPRTRRTRRHMGRGSQPRAPRDRAGADRRLRRLRRWTACSPPTACGSSGWTRDGSGSSRWSPSGPRGRTGPGS